MKKTLVAVAAMAAVTGAMAQATIYGNIDQAYTKSTTSVAGRQTSNTTTMGSYQMGSSQIGFKGEEDLGGGLKASARSLHGTVHFESNVGFWLRFEAQLPISDPN